MKFTTRQLPPGLLPLGQLPLNNSFQDNYAQTIAPPPPPPSSSPWTIIEKYFDLSRIESELHLSEAVIATGYPTKAVIVNPLLELRPFYTFFHC